MSFTITVTRSGVVSSYTQAQFEYAYQYMRDLSGQGIALTCEFS
jgi:hypothetical protein